MEKPDITRELQSDVGRQIRALRLAHNLAQSELARQAGVALGALKGLENGDGATVRTLASVAICLGRREWLLSLQPPQTPISGRLRAGKPKNPVATLTTNTPAATD